MNDTWVADPSAPLQWEHLGVMRGKAELVSAFVCGETEICMIFRKPGHTWHPTGLVPRSEYVAAKHEVWMGHPVIWNRNPDMLAFEGKEVEKASFPIRGSASNVDLAEFSRWKKIIERSKKP